MAEGVVSVCWKDHTSELATVYERLLENNFLVDCTISAEGQSLKAHRLVLSACSPYFHMLFHQETEKHPFVILLDASFEILRAVIDFVYRGETQISEGNLKAFLALAQSLQIKGLKDFSKNYSKNHSCNTTENDFPGPSKGKHNTCEVESVHTSHKDSPENSSQQHPHNSKDYPEAEHMISSVAVEGDSVLCEEVQSATVMPTSVKHQELFESKEVSIVSDITVKFEPLFPGFLSNPRNVTLDHTKCNDTMSGNNMSEMEGRTSTSEQDLNQFSSCSESSHGNTESSVIPPSQPHLMQLSDEMSSVRDVGAGDEPLLPSVLVPKREHFDGEEREEPIDYSDIQGNDMNEIDEGTEAANLDLCSSAAGLLPENDQTTERLSGKLERTPRAEQFHPPPSQHTALQSHSGRRADERQPSGEGAGLCEAASTSALAGHNRKRQHSCDVCGASFTSPSALVIHKSNHTGERPFRCDFCDASFTKSSVLVSHRRKHTGERPFACEVCGASFTKSSGLVSHMRKHTGERPFRCDVCGISFAQATTLANHKRTHTGERPYGCDVCGLAFTQQATLNQHMRMHTGERAYCCDVCGKAFVSKVDLNRHMRTHTGERPFSCDVCGVAFAQVCTLAIHKRTHTGERPYRCDVCGNAFSHANTLAVHMRIHTGERPFTCKVCGKTFTSKRNLGCHMRTHTGERPFRCGVCGKDFSNRSSFTYHKRTHAEEQL